MLFEGNMIVEFRHYFDMLTILQQIGVAPEFAGAETTEEVRAGM